MQSDRPVVHIFHSALARRFRLPLLTPGEFYQYPVRPSAQKD